MDIKSARGLMGLTQGEFAARIGVSGVTVRRWEKHRTSPSPLARKAITALLQHLYIAAVKLHRPRTPAHDKQA